MGPADAGPMRGEEGILRPSIQSHQISTAIEHFLTHEPLENRAISELSWPGASTHPAFRLSQPGVPLCTKCAPVVHQPFRLPDNHLLSRPKNF